MLNRAIFLDRDGTINVEVGHLDHESDLALIEGSAEGIALLKDAGFKIVIVTNQSVIARGRISELELRQIHLALTEVLSASGARFDAIYYCPHHPQEGDGEYTMSCDCRKPRPGMLLQASRELEIDLGRSYIVGDRLSDLEAGRAVGCVEILVRTGHGGWSEATLDEGVSRPDYVADDLLDAAGWIMEREGDGSDAG
jgi:D-glycero-D-manno-heptose 1,7-bisphosphate phosphatase